MVIWEFKSKSKQSSKVMIARRLETAVKVWSLEGWGHVRNLLMSRQPWHGSLAQSIFSLVTDNRPLVSPRSRNAPVFLPTELEYA